MNDSWNLALGQINDLIPKARILADLTGQPQVLHTHVAGERCVDCVRIHPRTEGNGDEGSRG